MCLHRHSLRSKITRNSFEAKITFNIRTAHMRIQYELKIVIRLFRERLEIVKEFKTTILQII